MNIRRQVYDLTQDDLILSPVWVFTHGEEDLSEEDLAEQDEATVRPVAEPAALDSLEVMFVTAARFSLADGTTMAGYISPGAPEDTGLGRLQPTIITEQGQVSFWFGILCPTPKDIAGAYKLLGKRPEQVFPISFSLAVQTKSPLSGTIPGFLSLDGPDFKAVRVSR